MHIRRAVTLVLVVAGLAALSPAGGHAGEAPLSLSVPKALSATGLVRYLLPRFRFRSRIRVVEVPAGAAADMALSSGPAGRVVFIAKADGARTALSIAAPDGPRHKAAKKFLDWLLSKPGRATIEAFPPGKPALYASAPKRAKAAVVLKLSGNAKRGHKLVLRHCSRCHVVDEKHPFTGIDSSPSFAGLRTRTDWFSAFSTFWSVAPHRSVISVIGVTDQKNPDTPSNIVPIRLTPEDINDIVAYVATIHPKNLGAPIAER